MNYLMDKELINNWQPLPADVPALPIPPTGFDRWHYVGKGFNPEGPIGRPWGVCLPHDRNWELAWDGNKDWPEGSSLGHYIVAVRDNEARRSLMRLYDVAKKLAHTLSPIDQEVWNALDDAEDVLCNEMWQTKDKR